MLRAPKELYTASDRNTDKGKDNPSSFKLSNSMGVGLHQKEDLREGCSKTFLHDLKTVRAAASHQAGPGVNQGSRRKSERSSTIPHEQSFLGTPALCFLPQCLARTLVQEFHQTERERERERERGVGTSLWSDSLWDVSLLLYQQHHKPDRDAKHFG